MTPASSGAPRPHQRIIFGFINSAAAVSRVLLILPSTRKRNRKSDFEEREPEICL
jgi:hypothetical protein